MKKKDFKEIFHKAGLKNTTPRSIIFETLSQITHPVTVQEIIKKIKGKKIDLVTLYRNLESFEKHKLVKRTDLHKDAVCYEINTGHHHHIVCTHCGIVEDFEVCDKDRLIKNVIAKASNFKTVEDHMLELFGICNKCVKK